MSTLPAILVIIAVFLFSGCASSSSASREATRPDGTNTSSVGKAQKWRRSIEAELTESYALVAGGGYDVSSSQLHVPVSLQLAEELGARPRTEVVAFLEQLKADEAHREQRDYISKCLEALKRGGERTKSRWKFADGREADVVYFHLPLQAVAKDGDPSGAKDEETITLSPFIDTFDWRPYHLTKATPDSADGYFRLISVSLSGDVTLRDLMSGKRILIRHDQTAKEITGSTQPMRVTSFDFGNQTADFEWLTTR